VFELGASARIESFGCVFLHSRRTLIRRGLLYRGGNTVCGEDIASVPEGQGALCSHGLQSDSAFLNPFPPLLGSALFEIFEKDPVDADLILSPSYILLR
jgi:hypothetical protein